MAIISVNPATERELARFEEDSESILDGKLERARKAFVSWRRTSFATRSAHLAAVAALLRRDRDRLAQLATDEMGKPIREARGEVEKCALAADYFAEHGERMLTPNALPSNATRSLVQFPPLGVVLAVMPWNFPFWQAMRAALPALMAGNVGLLKHASNVPQCALAIERVFVEAGLPEGVFQTLMIGSAAVERVILDERVTAITLTGSEAAGAKVAATAGSVLKKCVLELGGSDPFIVLEDADLELASTVACRARNQNNGQSCIAAKRFIVVNAVADEFQRLFCAKVAALKVGDPMDESTEVGPLARRDLVQTLQDQLRRSLAAGASGLVGGAALPGPGFYFQPTVAAVPSRDLPIMREETFGPLAALLRVGDEEEAIAVANDSQYGLGAAIFTNADRGERISSRIEAGLVFVNGLVASDPRLPFGGVKRSGYGRELSEFGIREFTNVQTVWVGPAV
ncbi:MAG: NAD-dependent succinate-semialdehyde dehydrogenase [Candidatus Dormibacteraceae bacterium]